MLTQAYIHHYAKTVILGIKLVVYSADWSAKLRI